MVSKKVRWLSIMVAASVSVVSSLSVNCFADDKEPIAEMLGKAKEGVWLGDVKQYMDLADMNVINFGDHSLDFDTAEFKASEGIPISHDALMGIMTIHSPSLAAEVRVDIGWKSDIYGKNCGAEPVLIVVGGYEEAATWATHYLPSYNDDNCKTAYKWITKQLSK